MTDHQGEQRPKNPDIEAEERVPLARVITELGWTQNTVRRYLGAARRLVQTFPDPQDSRKKLYPLQYTVKLLRREHGRIQARRLRRVNEGAGYWTALASLKVGAGRLRQLSTEASAVAREIAEAFEGLRRKAPLIVEIYTLSDPSLGLVHPLTVL